MSFTYVGLPVFHAQGVLPSDGDPAVAESVDVVLRDLLDNSAYLNAQMSLRVDFLSPGIRSYNQDASAFVSVVGNGTLVFATNLFLGSGGGGGPKNLTVISETSFTGNASTTFRNASVALVSPLTTIGSGPTQALTVNSTAEFNGPVQFDGAITSTAPATFNENVTLGSSVVDIVQVNGLLNVAADATFAQPVAMQSTLDVSGSATLGNNASDSHRLRGNVQLDNDLLVGGDGRINGGCQVDGDLDVDGDVTLGSGSANEVTINAGFSTRGTTTLGNSDSDELAINALLSTPLGFMGAGRVPFNLGSIGGSNEITPSSGNFIVFSTPSGVPTYTVSSEFSPGDFFFLCRGVGNATLQLSDTPIALGVATPAILCVKRSSGQSWSYIAFSGFGSPSGVIVGTTSA